MRYNTCKGIVSGDPTLYGDNKYPIREIGYCTLCMTDKLQETNSMYKWTPKLDGRADEDDTCEEGDVKSADSGGAEMKISQGMVFTPFVKMGSDWYPVCAEGYRIQKGNGFSQNNNGADTICKKLGFTSGQIRTDSLTSWAAKRSLPVGKCNAGEELPECSAGANAFTKTDEWWCKEEQKTGIRMTCTGKTANVRTNSCN